MKADGPVSRNGGNLLKSEDPSQVKETDIRQLTASFESSNEEAKQDASADETGTNKRSSLAVAASQMTETSEVHSNGEESGSHILAEFQT